MTPNLSYFTHKSSGFTLLEVLIAITLTGLVMGSLFALQSQNKKLSVRSLDALKKITAQRAQINSAWIDVTDYHNSNYQVNNITTLAIPEQLQQPTTNSNNFKFRLESVDITNTSNEILFSTTRIINTR